MLLFLAHLSLCLKVIYCDRPSSVVRPSVNASSSLITGSNFLTMYWVGDCDILRPCSLFSLLILDKGLNLPVTVKLHYSTFKP